jgi:hypothetical protein
MHIDRSRTRENWYNTVRRSAQKWKTTILMILATTGCAIVSGIVQASGAPPLAVFITGMLALIASGSLLRHSVRHLVNWFRVSIGDLQRSHMVAGAVDCLLGYVNHPPRSSHAKVCSHSQDESRVDLFHRSIGHWEDIGGPDRCDWLHSVQHSSGPRPVLPGGNLGR